MLLVVTFGVAFNMVQTNVISDVLRTSHAVAVQWTTVGLVVLAAPVLVGGIRAVSRVAGAVLPIVAAGYVALALVIVAVNITELPRMFEQIIGGAFGIREMAGGFSGGFSAALLNGVRRGLFSNEAGMGSAPNIAAAATVSHPVLQGLIQSLGVFVDAGHTPVFIAAKADLPGVLDGSIWAGPDRHARDSAGRAVRARA